MKNSKICVLVIVALYCCIESRSATETDGQDQNERSGRSWHQSRFGPQMLMNHQPSVSTSQPDGPNQQQPQPSELDGPNRNLEENDKSALPFEQDLMLRHFFYLNAHRFDPNFSYYDRNAYSRFPSSHAPRLGPGYRKDKYGEGYGYSCKQGDDCEEVKAENQFAARLPTPAPYSPDSFNQNPMSFQNQFPDIAPYDSMPSFPNMNSFSGGYESQFEVPPPAMFSDPQPQPPPPLHQSMFPYQYYHARYLHDEDHKVKESLLNASQQGNKTNSK